MSKIARKIMKIFGSTSGTNQIEQFGSLAAGAPVYTTDPTVIQALSNYLEGWFGGVVGSNLPAIEDVNAICYLYAYQLAYLMQEGIAEWDSGTTYYIGSLVNNAGVIYVSLTDNNLNHALTDTTNWQIYGAAAFQTFNSSGTFVAPAGVKKVTVQPVLNYRAFEPQGQNMGTMGMLDVYGSIYTWGLGAPASGALGNNGLVAVSSPVLVTTPSGVIWNRVVVCGNTTGISGRASMFGITNQGFVYSWGLNEQGQLGIGTQVNASTPTLISAPLSSIKVTKIVYDVNSNAFFLTSGGQLYACGQNQYGQLGIGSVAAASVPTLVSGGHLWTNVWCGGGCTFGLATDGNLYGWGENLTGQLGVGDIIPKSVPTLVVGGLSFSQVYPDQNNSASTFNSVLGLTTDGKLWAWGINDSGQLGVGDVVNRSSPTLVLGGRTWQSAKIAVSQSMGLGVDGNLYVWGQSANGNLSFPINTPVSSPVLVTGGFTWSKFDCVGLSSRASLWGITTDGHLYAWGDNTNGQLGTGDLTNRSSPVLVVGGNLWDQFTVMDQTSGLAPLSVGVTTTGNVYVWGNGAGGLLGNGSAVISTTTASSPQLVVGSFLAQPSGFDGQRLPEIPRSFPVSPGSSYSIVIAPNGLSTFNNIAVGMRVPGLTLIYEY